MRLLFFYLRNNDTCRNGDVLTPTVSSTFVEMISGLTINSVFMLTDPSPF